ncbi:MAG: hypothetical protein MUF00_21615, partial [Gemmatimonadaceae bacterium]|nr:hypothetical protein [Gemmatimonadaceae bacterium]
MQDDESVVEFTCHAAESSRLLRRDRPLPNDALVGRDPGEPLIDRINEEHRIASSAYYARAKHHLERPAATAEELPQRLTGRIEEQE